MNLFLFKNFTEKYTRFLNIFLFAQSLTIFSVFSMNYQSFYPKNHTCSDSINSILELDSKEFACGLTNGSIEIFNSHHTRFLHGHTTDWVSALIQIDEKHLASSSYDKTIRILNLKTHECVKILTGHKAGITSLKKLRNSAMLVSTSYDCSIRLWDTDSGDCINELTEHNQVVCDVIELSNGSLASVSDDGCLKIWNTETGECLATCQTSFHLVYVIEPQEGILIAKPQCDNTIIVWDFINKKTASQLTCNAVINNICVLKNGTIAAALNNGTIEIWNLKNLHRITILDGHTHCVKDVVALDEKTLASSSNDGSIKIWDLETSKCLKTLIEKKDVYVWKIFRRRNGDLISIEGPRLMRIWPKSRIELD